MTVDLLKCRIYGEATYVGESKTKFRATLGPTEKKVKYHEHFHEHYGQHNHTGIDDRQFTLIEQSETHEQLKKKEIFR